MKSRFSALKWKPLLRSQLKNAPSDLQQSGKMPAPFKISAHLFCVTPIHPETRIGHVHLKVADLDRAIAFYNGVLVLRSSFASEIRPPSSLRVAIIIT